MNESGEGVAKDPARAAGLYDQACEGGDINGCSNEEGHYSKACEGGDANGCSFLGDYYRAGIGVAKDPDKARQFLTKGCNMGDQVGCDWLKKMHWWHWW
jgi:TPR repeat protein